MLEKDCGGERGQCGYTENGVKTTHVARYGAGQENVRAIEIEMKMLLFFERWK